jgi:hypothetical protein
MSELVVALRDVEAFSPKKIEPQRLGSLFRSTDSPQVARALSLAAGDERARIMGPSKLSGGRVSERFVAFEVFNGRPSIAFRLDP